MGDGMQVQSNSTVLGSRHLVCRGTWGISDPFPWPDGLVSFGCEFIEAQFCWPGLIEAGIVG